MGGILADVYIKSTSALCQFIPTTVSNTRPRSHFYMFHHSTCSESRSAPWEPFPESQLVPCYAQHRSMKWCVHCSPLVAPYRHKGDLKVCDRVSPPSGRPPQSWFVSRLEIEEIFEYKPYLSINRI